MLTESVPENRLWLRLDELGDENALGSEVRFFEDHASPLVTVEASLGTWARVKPTLLALRAANVSALLLLQKPIHEPTFETLLEVFAFLREWDQLLLHNFISLCGDHLPPPFKNDFAIETKIEMKWFREWLMASHDPRISKYPGLPWRSFIRKITSENYTFAQTFLEVVYFPEEVDAEKTLPLLLKNFLQGRKKAICLFPKRWGKAQ
jgi:hypothetical protein